MFFNIIFMFISCYACLFIYVMYSVFLYCFEYCFSFIYTPIIEQVYRPLPPGGNPTSVNKYHIIYIISRQSALEGGKVVNPMNRPSLPPKIFLVLISVRG